MCYFAWRCSIGIVDTDFATEIRVNETMYFRPYVNVKYVAVLILINYLPKMASKHYFRLMFTVSQLKTCLERGKKRRDKMTRVLCFEMASFIILIRNHSKFISQKQFDLWYAWILSFTINALSIMFHFNFNFNLNSLSYNQIL